MNKHPSCKNFENYTSPDGKYQGSLNTFTGPEVDWLVYSWLGQPKTSFCNMHLNMWLGPQVDVPHVSFVFGTVPDFFAYSDFPPRYDLWDAPEYCDKYYDGHNDSFLKWRSDQRVEWFVSNNVYMRVCLSPNAICHTGATDPALLKDMGAEYHNRLDSWIKWVDEAPAVPEWKRAELLARDRRIRKAVAERDPVNELAERMLGKEMMAELVDALWGVEQP